MIEIKAFGVPGCGDFIWLESNQVESLERVLGARLYLVANVRSADPSEMRILDREGE